jgi:large subunit ribosomal protein L29
MKIHDVRDLKDEDLKKLIEDEEKNLIDLRFAHQLKQLTNTSKLKLIKKDLARMKTVLRERQLAVKTSAANNKQEGVKA